MNLSPDKNDKNQFSKDKNQNLSPNPKHQLYGRHGDIKPENVLWFKTFDNPGMGVLKISDFGLTRFHKKDTKSGINAQGTPVSLTYRAPEYDTTAKLSQSYDIWTVGCLILEFLTWYLLGWEAVLNDFSDCRGEGDEDENGFSEDKFFKVVQLDSEGEKFGAVIKPQVIDWIHKLREQAACTDLIHELLDLVQRHLLVVASRHRASCGVAVSKLEQMWKKSLKDEKYCLDGKPRPPPVEHTRSDSLEATPLIPMSDEKKTAFARIAPNHKGPTANRPTPSTSQLSLLPFLSDAQWPITTVDEGTSVDASEMIESNDLELNSDELGQTITQNFTNSEINISDFDMPRDEHSSDRNSPSEYQNNNQTPAVTTTPPPPQQQDSNRHDTSPGQAPTDPSESVEEQHDDMKKPRTVRHPIVDVLKKIWHFVKCGG